ncbi:hypothetical protein RR48_05262 [Papilio machaon]|uniref:Uncharacterized protein n=1 Tax=Papilio machaon TaxID=76193 RepID=A0A0N1IP95_PAPMA|nr:hypothetical protein RR48_05262 [Papilio machaon]
MKKSDNLDKELANQIEEHKKANYELASLRSKLQYIDETLQILISFQKFLYNAAPVLWQDKNKLNLVTSNLDIFNLDSDIFCEVDVTLVIEKLKELPQAILYFENPAQILNIFQSLEQQNLNYLLKTVELRSEKNRFLKSASLLEDLLRNELDFIQEQMHSVQKGIEEDEKREKELKEEFFNILNDKIKYLVCSENVLQISNYVEFAYEQLIGPNETKLSTLDQILALEQEYNSVMLELSAFDLNEVKSIEKIIYEDGAKEIKQAKDAAKILKDVDKLTKRLKISYNLKNNL